MRTNLFLSSTGTWTVKMEQWERGFYEGKNPLKSSTLELEIDGASVHGYKVTSFEAKPQHSEPGSEVTLMAKAGFIFVHNLFPQEANVHLFSSSLPHLDKSHEPCHECLQRLN